MREITDTTNRFESDPIPEGRRVFVVASEPKKKFKGENEYWIWRFQWETGIGDQLLLPNMMGGLLRALGFTEIEKNKFDWDTLECEGKAFIAEAKLVPDKKDPKIVRTHMGSFAAVQSNEIQF